MQFEAFHDQATGGQLGSSLQQGGGRSGSSGQRGSAGSGVSDLGRVRHHDLHPSTTNPRVEPTALSR